MRSWRREKPFWKMAAFFAWAMLLVATTGVSQSYNRTIYVDPERGSNNESCLTNSSPDNACRNLSYVFQPQYRQSSTRYLLLPGIHYLNDTASKQPFTSLSDLAITGNETDGSVDIVCSDDNAGLAFDNVEDVTLQNLTIRECGAVQNSTSQNYSSVPNFTFSLTRVALYFNNCQSLTMDTVQVLDSRKATGAIIYNTIGRNSFTNCNFSGNNGDPSGIYPGGGGVYVEFSYCLPGNYDYVNGTLPYHTQHNKDSIYVFDECTFSQNEALASSAVTSTPTFIVPYETNHVAFGRGGGLSVFFNGDAHNNSFTVNNCIFSGNRAKYGGGLFVEFHDSALGNRVVVQGSSTEFNGNNSAEVAGGGMRVAHYVFNNDDVEEEGEEENVETKTNNMVQITSVLFTNNSAESGGGLSISPSLQNTTISAQVFSVSVNQVQFQFNHAPYGAALRIELFGLNVVGQKPYVVLSRCIFFNNSVYPPSFAKPVEVGIGTLYISHIDVHIVNHTLFLYNFGTALAQAGSSVYFTGIVNFFVNRGIDGGAIALLGSARMVIDSGTNMSFLNNVASRGGAIYNVYADKNNYRNSPQCFIVHVNPFILLSNWGAKFDFKYNYDSQGPNAIYSTSILPCALSGGSYQEAVKKILCWNDWTYNGTNDDCSNHIRTGPGLIHSNHYVPISDRNRESTSVTAYSGQTIQLYYEALDDLNHTVTVAYAATVTNGSKPDYHGAKLDPYYAYVTHGSLKVYQYTGTNKSVIVNLDEVGDRAWHIELNITLESCPPGLLETNVSCNSHNMCTTCECNRSANYNNAVRCNNNSNASLANNYWMGPPPGRNGTGGTRYVTGVCPTGYCRNRRSELSSPLPANGSELDEFICGPQNRAGVLCGRCAKDYGLALNSDTHECVLCNVSRHRLALHTTYYVLAVYLPLFLLFLAIIVFNIKLTVGPANSFILFSQLISSTFDINRLIPLSTVLPHSYIYVHAYKFIYGLSNLEFLEQFIPGKHMCLGTHLNVLDKMLLDFTVALSPMFMILSIVFVYKTNCCCGIRSQCRRNKRTVSSLPSRSARRVPFGRIGDSVLPAIASFILLSYNKFCLTASYLTVTEHLHRSDGHETDSARVFYAGVYSADEWEYNLFYKLPAIFVFLTFVAIPPLLLLRFPLELLERKVIFKMPYRLQRYYPKVKLHILLDTFQGSFKNRYRGFAGLYFFFRIVINVNYILVGVAYQYMIQGIYCIIIALLVAYFKPYRSKFHVFNYVDSLVFVNLAVINQISFYLYTLSLQRTALPLGAFVVQYILVFLPLVYMIGYVVWILLPIPRVRERAREWLEARRYPQQMDNLIQNSRDDTSSVGDDVDWERARDVNRYRRPHRSNPDGPLHSSVTSPSDESANNSSNTDDNPTSPPSSTFSNSVRGYGSTDRSDSGITVVNSHTATTTTEGTSSTA